MEPLDNEIPQANPELPQDDLNVLNDLARAYRLGQVQPGIVIGGVLHANMGAPRQTKNQPPLTAKQLNRHLRKQERDRQHRPSPDWRESPRGEEPCSHSSLDISDIISKHKM